MAGMQDLSAINVHILKFRLIADNFENDTAVFELSSGRNSAWLIDIVVRYSGTPFESTGMARGSSMSLQQFLDSLGAMG